ncbi:MAG: TonB family protein [Acidobacteria bacterium]|nr:TonB family protein [Acidobacteriota bacterium]
MFFRLFSATLALMLAVCGSAQGQNQKWFELSSRHFLLFTDTNEAKGRRLLSDFEARVETLSRAIGDVPNRQFPVEIFLFKSEEDFIQAAPRVAPPSPNPNSNIPFGMGRFSDRPDKNAYVYRGPDRIFIVAKDKAPEDIADHVAHSLGHILFERVVVWRPFWLAEGAAEYFRRIGRDPDKKTFSEKDGFTVEELITIVPSSTYDDNEPGGAFRTLSYRLLRILLNENVDALRDYFAQLRRKDLEEKPQIDIETKAFEEKLKSYAETALPAAPTVPAIKSREITSDAVAIQRGYLMLAAGSNSEALRWLNAEGPEARAARAIVNRFSRSPLEAARVLDRAAREVPDHGLLQYHFGALETENAKDIESQAQALERALKLLPLMGRAHSELARVYALTGRAPDSFPLLDRAFELEPEFADRYFEIRADVNVALGRFDEALHDIQIADILPHTGKEAAERVSLKVAAVRKRIETIRREAEDRRLQELRRQVSAEVARREPPPKPAPPPPPVPEGVITYQIEARAIIEVVDATYPEYPEELRKAGTKGNIALNVTVGADGNVASATIAHSQAPALNASTIEAVKKWVFKPGNRSIRLIMTFALQ